MLLWLWIVSMIGARRSAAEPRPFEGQTLDGRIQQRSPDYQATIARALATWLISLKSVWISYVGELGLVHADVVARLEHVRADKAELAPRVGDRPPLGLVTAGMTTALALVAVIAVATLYPWVESWGWILPLTLVAALALALLEFVVAALNGFALGAVIYADHEDTFRLAPRERTAAAVFVVVTGIALVLLVLMLAGVRGDFGIWTLVGLVALLLSVAIGVVVYRGRHLAEHLRLTLLERHLERLSSAVSTRHAVAQAEVQARGLWMLRTAERLIARSDAAFARKWSRLHWRERDRTVPIPPPAPLPNVEEILTSLAIPLTWPGRPALPR